MVENGSFRNRAEACGAVAAAGAEVRDRSPIHNMGHLSGGERPGRGSAPTFLILENIMKRRIFSFLLAVVMVLSLAPSVFAAEGDGMSFAFSNTTPNPGDTISVLVTIDAGTDFSTAMGYESHLYFDKEQLTVEKIEILGTSVSNLTTVDKANKDGEVRFAEFNFDDDETIANNYVRNLSGEFARVTFKVSEYAGGMTLAFRMDVLVWDIDYEFFVDSTKSDSLSVQGTARPKPTTTGYSVSMAADQTVAAGETVSIPVTVASSEKRITGFNAYDMTFTYDPTALTLNTTSNAAANLTVEDNNGTVRVRRYGEAVELGTALTLDFTAKKGAASTVTLTEAKFDLDANSINFDAPDATVTDADTVVNANNFTVTLPDDFTSDAETRLVPAGGSFTFKPVDSHYDYAFTVKVGDTVTEGQTFGGDGTYTVSGVNGNVEVTVTSKTPQQYDVTYRYLVNFKDLEVPEEILKGPAKATYNGDYSFSIRPRNDTSYRVDAVWGQSTDTQRTLRGTANPDGTITYTLDKYFVKKDFTIRIMATPDNKYNVVFNGNGAEDVDPGAPSSVGANNPYYFKLNKRENCDYTVTAVFKTNRYDGSQNINGIVTETSNGQYMITTVNGVGGGNAKTWTLEITITKVSHNAEEVDVTTYLNLDGKTMMLVTVKGTPENGSAFTYDGNTMYKVEGYGTDWYAWLVILEKDQTLTKEDAAAKVAVSAADNVVTIANGYDVNMTGVVDINDAQLVYDIYNGTYGDFGKVSMEKFLRADVNASKNVDSADAVAIVSQFK